MLYGGPVISALEKAGKIGIDIIAPSHGIIWTKNISEIIKCYADWAECKSTSKVCYFLRHNVEKHRTYG